MSDALVLLILLLFGASAFYFVFERLKARQGERDSSLYVQALRDLLDGREEAAFGKLREVVADDTTNVDAYLRLGQVLRNYQQPERALQIHKDLTLRSGLTKSQKSAILRQLAIDYRTVGDISTAEKALVELISIDPNDRTVMAELMRIQEQTGRWEDAYATAEKILKIEQNKSKRPLAKIKLRQGMSLAGKREYHKARIIFKEAISLDPMQIDAYLAIGDAYVEERRFEDALEFWGKLLTVAPEQADRAVDRMKRTLFELGRYGDIVEFCQSILAKAPKSVEARKTLARYYEKKGDNSQALELLEAVVEDNPSDAIAILELGRLYMERGDTRKLDLLVRRLSRPAKASANPVNLNDSTKTPLFV